MSGIGLQPAAFRGLRRTSDRRYWLAAALLSMAGTVSARPAALIPLPNEMTAGQGSFHFATVTPLSVPGGDVDAAQAARYFSALVASTHGFHPAVRAGAPATGSVRFERQQDLPDEAYRLLVTPRGISIFASSAAGYFYGAVTLWQLLPEGRGAVEVAAVQIRDVPAYRWRGLMLDSARHLQSPAFIRSMIDWMAWHKLNVLHWHLTDDQGWRLPVRKYPRLCTVSAWRTAPPLSIAAVDSPHADRYGGCYTPEQIRQIVTFAASRHVLIVPEIDMPGHAQAAIAAYPVLGASEGPAPPVSASWGVHTFLYNLEPETFRFVDDVLAAVMEFFPGPYVHVGGDEVAPEQWLSSARVQARARALGIHEPAAIEAWFMHRVGQYLSAHGRRLVGWDEIMQPGLAHDAVVMSWRGTAGAHAAAISDRDTVLAAWPTLYFDNRQSALSTEPPGRTRVVSLEDVYRFETLDPTLTAGQQHHVLGVQANLWTEHIRTEDRLAWMALPRAAALAEIAWTAPAHRDWRDFVARLAASMQRYRALGIPVADSAFAVDGRVAASAQGYTVNLANQANYGELRFTLDGSDPTRTSTLYSSPVAVAVGTEMRAAAFAEGERLSGIWSRRLQPQALARQSSRELDLCSDGVGLLLEPPDLHTLVALDIMNPCWIYRRADLSHGARVTAAAVALPFNYELGAEVRKIRVGDARTRVGELEIYVDSCTGLPAATMALPAATAAGELHGISLAPLAGTHDLCLRFARPTLNPMWALDWVDVEAGALQ
jgi:hexosaminidase